MTDAKGKDFSSTVDKNIPNPSSGAASPQTSAPRPFTGSLETHSQESIELDNNKPTRSQSMGATLASSKGATSPSGVRASIHDDWRRSLLKSSSGESTSPRPDSISGKIKRSVFDKPLNGANEDSPDSPEFPMPEDSMFSTIHPAVFQSASTTITDLYNKGVPITYERAAEILTKFQKASAVAQHHFPGSRDGKLILRQTKNVLSSEGFTSENTLFGQSVCADEINHDVDGISSLFSSYLGEVFHLSGLAGIPFTGKTGFAAYSHHIPDDGHLFILFAPHVGISESLQVGKYTRAGQTYEGHACGAAIGALNHCMACKPVPDASTLGANPLDYQMNFIISEVAKHVDSIACEDNCNDMMAALTQRMYIISRAFMEGIVDINITDSHGKPVKIAILGGVQINMPRPMSDFFQPLTFEIREKNKPTIDCLERAFYSDSNSHYGTRERRNSM